MKALSFSQPWLWSILHAGKRVENRSWAPPMTMIDQRIALHAAKSWDGDAVGFFVKLGIEFPSRKEMYTQSAIVGTAIIDRVVTADKSLPADQKRWFFGAFGWILRDIVVLLEPIPCNGKLGLWTVPPDIEGKISPRGPAA